jgi:transposase InsO family protein
LITVRKRVRETRDRARGAPTRDGVAQGASCSQKALGGDRSDGRRGTADPGRLPRPERVGVRLPRPTRSSTVATGDQTRTAHGSDPHDPRRLRRWLWRSADAHTADTRACHEAVAILRRRACRASQDVPDSGGLRASRPPAISSNATSHSPSAISSRHRHHRTSDREGKAYCAVVLDVFSRRVVGWAIDASQTRAAGHARAGHGNEQRGPSNGTVIHSDQGTRFASWAFTQRAIDPGLVPSMGSIGNCHDNAVIESFLESDASRAARPATLADARRVGERDLRIAGDLPQSPASALVARDAHTHRVRSRSITDHRSMRIQSDRLHRTQGRPEPA